MPMHHDAFSDHRDSYLTVVDLPDIGDRADREYLLLLLWKYGEYQLLCFFVMFSSAVHIAEENNRPLIYALICIISRP